MPRQTRVILGDKAPLWNSCTLQSVCHGKHAEKAVLPSSGERCVRSDGKRWQKGKYRIKEHAVKKRENVGNEKGAHF